MRSVTVWEAKSVILRVLAGSGFDSQQGRCQTWLTAITDENRRLNAAGPDHWDQAACSDLSQVGPWSRMASNYFSFAVSPIPRPVIRKAPSLASWARPVLPVVLSSSDRLLGDLVSTGTGPRRIGIGAFAAQFVWFGDRESPAQLAQAKFCHPRLGLHATTHLPPAIHPSRSPPRRQPCGRGLIHDADRSYL